MLAEEYTGRINLDRSQGKSRCSKGDWQGKSQLMKLGIHLTVYEIGEVSGKDYIATELIDSALRSNNPRSLLC